MKIKNWIIIAINTLIIISISSITILYYLEFKKALDKQVLSQLSSIERLKRIHIEKLIKERWLNFKDNEYSKFLKNVTYPQIENTLNSEGIYDVSHLTKEKKVLIAFVKKDTKNKTIKYLNNKEIQSILDERTGMGKSGETYLVGPDQKLRSQSRFFKKSAPLTLRVPDKSFTFLKNNKKNNRKIIKDYRNQMVYSAYYNIKISQIEWIITSEIDVAEVIVPLRNLKFKLLLIALIIFGFSTILGVFITKNITKPLQKIQNSIKRLQLGDYTQNIESNSHFIEIHQILLSLTSLQHTLHNAVLFSIEIGNMNLTTHYNIENKTDLLGLSLIKMREQLITYQSKIVQLNNLQKQNLIKGQEMERKRLAQELHDGIGPLLTSLKFAIEIIDFDPTKKIELKKLLDTTIEETRKITFDLMPSTLLDFGIGITLETYIQLIQQSTPIQIQFNNSTKDIKSKINTEVALTLYRICQELINNSLKHSKATNIKFSITEFKDRVSLYYFDNGIGFNENEIKYGYGIKNIKERVEIFNGFFDMQTEKNNFTIEIEIPL